MFAGIVMVFAESTVTPAAAVTVTVKAEDGAVSTVAVTVVDSPSAIVSSASAIASDNCGWSSSRIVSVASWRIAPRSRIRVK